MVKNDQSVAPKNPKFLKNGALFTLIRYYNQAALFQGMISENYVNQGIVHFWYYVISSITVILVTCVEQGPPVNEIFG